MNRDQRAFESPQLVEAAVDVDVAEGDEVRRGSHHRADGFG